MPVHQKPSRLTEAELVAVVRTGTERRGVGKIRALELLRQRPRTDAAELMQDVAADRSERPRLRHLAVMGLYELGRGRGEKALVEAAQNADSLTAPTIALGLGRVGSVDQIGIVDELTAISHGDRRGTAAFAGTLLAYRHDLGGHDVKAPTSRQLQQVGSAETQPIRIKTATPTVTKMAARALLAEPLDVEIVAVGAQRIACDPNTFVWMWTGQGGRDLAGMGRGVAGVLYRKSRFDDSFSMSAIALASPRRDGTMLTLHRPPSGDVMYAGLVTRDGEVTLRSRKRPGQAAIELIFTVDGTRVKVHDARSAIVVRERRTPQAG